MSIQKKITLTDKGVNAGPTYNVSYSSDCVAYTASVNVTLGYISASAVVNVPDNTQCIKLTSIGDCTNEIIKYIGTGSTTTTTAGPTTTTTTTTLAPTTTTTLAPTTTTLAPTTTTTTVPQPIGGYYYYAVAGNCCNPRNESIVGVVAITSSLGILIDGQTLGNNDYTSSTGTHCVSVKYVTSSITPLLFVIEESQAFTNTYGLDQCNSCNRDFIPTPGSGICLAYDLVNANATLTYVSCSGTPTTSSTTGGTFEFCSRTAPVITYVDPIYEKQFARLAVDCANCGTY
jgi:hypothetical protein